MIAFNPPITSSSVRQPRSGSSMTEPVADQFFHLLGLDEQRVARTQRIALRSSAAVSPAGARQAGTARSGVGLFPRTRLR
ncbi:hypothetical protein ACFVXH_40305 [Kitasatospora sp. NPDC058184]|uniref:hypothetical protein n=1 Tax=Kitasatospora sp. NPDC058184 TaxID=3346370 RepID=UPI0036DF3A96